MVAVVERGVKTALLWNAMEDGDVRCVACAHRCLIRPGRRGICRVRENRDGSLVSLVYGEAASVALDPIEKKPLFHAYPGTSSFSIATRGCNFHCRHCQNWEISQADRPGLAAQATHLPPQRVVDLAREAGARSVAYTYVEPTVFLEYMADTAALAHEAGLANVIITNGYQTPEALRLLGPLIDAANVDLKAFDDGFYRRVCGGRLEPVLDALVELRRLGVWVEVTTLLIPGLNTDAAQLENLAGWLVEHLGPEVPWHVSRFFPAHLMHDLPPTPIAEIERAVEIGLAVGLRHVYTGNLRPEVTETCCAGCGELLLRRSGYRLVANRLTAEGRCPACRRPLAGIGLAREPIR